MLRQNDDLENMVDENWKINGNFNEVVNRYSELDSSVTEDVLERRKKLLQSLKGNLLDPSQESVLDYALDNVDDLMIFESGGTFGFFANNFLDIIYADAISRGVREKGKKAVNFFIIDPTDISRFERTLNFAGRKIKMPIPARKIENNKSTECLDPPSKLDLKTFADALEKELELYFADIIRVNHSFKRETEQGEEFKQERDRLRQRWNQVRERMYALAGESKTYRDFTDKLLVEFISPLASNSVIVTLPQWQSAWDVADRFTKSDTYEGIDSVSGEIERKGGLKERSLGRLKREDGMYNFPFRIDNHEWMFSRAIFDPEKGKVYINENEVGSEDPSVSMTIPDLFSDRFNLLPKGGLLYAIDSLAYDAIPLIPPEPRVAVGYELASKETNPKPFLEQQEIPFYSIGRRLKTAPDTKKSGVVAAGIEGLDSEFIYDAFKSKAEGEFSISSPLFTKHNQPSS